LFPVDQASLTEQSKSNRQKSVTGSARYGDTNFLAKGHTDNIGTEAYNLDLSKAQTASLKDFLTTLEVIKKRLSPEAFREAKPIVANDTKADRQQNHGLVAAICTNEKMKKAAKHGDFVEF
jgi:outer membrane protein OmpA-like peptidoglycan-associated protein